MLDVYLALPILSLTYVDIEPHTVSYMLMITSMST